MITALVIYAALTVGAVLGFFLASLLRAGASPAPTRPEALAAEPREIVAVYEARREMERRGESCIHPSRQGDHKDRPYGGGR